MTWAAASSGSSARARSAASRASGLIHTDLPVDERVWLRPADVAAGKDTVVDAALRWLRQELAAAPH